MKLNAVIVLICSVCFSFQAFEDLSKLMEKVLSCVTYPSRLMLVFSVLSMFSLLT